MNLTEYFTSDYMGIEINGEMLDASVYKGKYYDQFAWLPIARDGGSVTYHGLACQKWSAHIPISGARFVLLVSEATSVPVYMLTNTTYAGGTYVQEAEFTQWTDDESLLPDIWTNYSEAAFKHPAACAKPADPTPIDTPIYVFHPKDEFNISGQDVGDGTGDVFFVCVDVLTNQATSVDHHYQWISSWTLRHNPQLGQYQNCNGYPPQCLGAENYLVGHEAAQGLGSPIGGQCKTNSLTGEWWSLPPGGRCEGSATPEGGTCTWKATRTKTIDSKCLLDLHGFKAACAADGRAPFAKATKIFLQALAKDEISEGGCPPLNVTQ